MKSRNERRWFNRLKKKLGPAPSRNDMQAEYVDLCAKAGQLQYKIALEQKELSDINQQLRELNQKYSKCYGQVQDGQEPVQEAQEGTDEGQAKPEGA